MNFQNHYLSRCRVIPLQSFGSHIRPQPYGLGLTLSSTAQVICDLVFLMLTAQKSIKQKKSEKNHILGEVFSLYVLLQDFPLMMMPFDLL